jgi:iron complex outermembrane receptor protein
VDGVPGPDNRLDRQAPAIANLGLDQRLTAWPLLVGGSLSWVPGYRTRLSATEAVRTPTRTVVDAYALWTIDATMALRLTLGNLLPSDGTSERDVVAPAVDGTVTAESVRATSESSTSVQLRLEMKL